MSKLTFYRHPLSGHSHRVEFFLSILGLDATVVNVDLMSGAHKKPDFLQKNAFGQVPVLTDGDLTLADSTAILVYLAKQYDKSGQWLPENSVLAAQVQGFLSLASGPIASGPATARLITVFGAPYDAVKVIAAAHNVLTIINTHLEGKNYLVGQQATLADVALYAYIAHAPEGNVDLSRYHNILTWLEHVRAIKGFIPMQSSAAGLAA